MPGLLKSTRYGHLTESGAAAQSAVSQIVEMKQKASEIAKNDAAADTSITDNHIKQADEYRGRIESIIGAPADQKQSLWDQEVTKEEQTGTIQPGQVSHTYPGDDTATALANRYALGSKIISESQDQEKADAANWKEFPTLGVITNVRTGETRTPAGQILTPAMMEAKYVQIQQAQKLEQPVSPQDQAFIKSYQGLKELVPAFNFNLQNSGATGTPGKPSSIAQGLADGTMKWQDVVSARTPMSVKQDLLAEVKGIKPDFNSGDFSVEQKVKEKYTSGNVGDQLLAIGTAREHMKTFGALADALNNGNVQKINQIGNELGLQFGSDAKTNFNIAAQAFGGEVGKAFDGAGVVAGEREEAQKNFNDAMSKGQFKGAIQTVDNLLAGKQKAAKEAYGQGVQAKPNFGGGAAQSGASATQPAGATHIGPDGKAYRYNGTGDRTNIKNWSVVSQ